MPSNSQILRWTFFRRILLPVAASRKGSEGGTGGFRSGPTSGGGAAATGCRDWSQDVPSLEGPRHRLFEQRVMIVTREAMIAAGHEEDLFAARGRGEFVEQAGRVAANDLVLLADHEEKLARVVFQAVD